MLQVRILILILLLRLLPLRLHPVMLQVLILLQTLLLLPLPLHLLPVMLQVLILILILFRRILTFLTEAPCPLLVLALPRYAQVMRTHRALLRRLRRVPLLLPQRNVAVRQQARSLHLFTAPSRHREPAHRARVPRYYPEPPKKPPPVPTLPVTPRGPVRRLPAPHPAL